MSQVFIAGAGIIGSSIAWRLALAGLEVELVDAGKMGQEASWAGAGMLAPGGEFDEPSSWADLARESYALYPEFIKDLSVASGVPIDWSICGALEMALTDAERAHLERRALRQQDLGISSEPCPQGRFYPDDGWVDPRQVLEALRVACCRAGVRLREYCPVRHLDLSAHSAVVIAAGAWSSQISVTCGGNCITLPEVSPAKGHLIGYDMEPGSLESIRRAGHTYLLQRSGGFTIAGSSEQDAGFSREIDEEICRGLHARACQLWPALKGREPSQCWIGFRPKPAAQIPHIGRVSGTNLWLAYGHYRNGILLAPVTAARVAAEITSSLGKG